MSLLVNNPAPPRKAVTPTSSKTEGAEKKIDFVGKGIERRPDACRCGQRIEAVEQIDGRTSYWLHPN